MSWTVKTLRKHMLALIAAAEKANEQRFQAQGAAVSAALAASDRAVQKAELAADKRFEGVNEFRAALADQQRNLIPRAEVDVIVKGLSDKQSGTQKQVDALLSERAGIRGGWGYAVGLIGIVIAILSFLK